jgi:hypothetical protein
VTHDADGQPRWPIVSMDLTEAFTADRAPVDLVQIVAFEELCTAACGTLSGYRASDGRPDAYRKIRIAYGHSVGPGLKVIFPTDVPLLLIMFPLIDQSPYETG